MYFLRKSEVNVLAFLTDAIIVSASLLGINHLIWSLYFFSYGDFIKDCFKYSDYAFLFLTLFFVFAYCFVLLRESKTKKMSIFILIRYFFSAEQILLIVLCLLTFVSTLAISIFESKNIIKDNIYNLYNVGVEAFFLFPLGRYYKNYKPKKIISILGNAVPILASLYAFVILCLAFQKISFDWGNSFPIGINSNYQLCTNCNPNTTGMIYALLTLLCLWSMLSVSKRYMKCVYCGAFLTDFLLLILTNSRGSFIGTAIGICLIVEAMIFKRFDKQKRIIKWILVIGVFCVVFLTITLFRSLFMYLFDSVTDYSLYLGRTDGTAERELNPLNSSGRWEIWVYSLKLIFSDAKTFLFGVSPWYVSNGITMISNGKFTNYTHNQFLEVAVAVGVPGMLTYIGWLVLIARNCVRLLIDNIKTKYSVCIVPACIIMALVIINLVEAYLLFTLNFVGSIFAFICGFVSGKTDKEVRLDNVSGK